MRLLDVHRDLRTTLAAAALATLAACGASPGAPDELTCSNIGLRKGISLDIDPAYAAKVDKATLKTCWENTCRDSALALYPSSRTSAAPCTGTDPNSACAAYSVPTGGKNGFAELMDLPAAPVDATLTLIDAAGAPVAAPASGRTLRITPEVGYPDGPECGGGTPQTGLIVSADGTVSERP
ncbi:MAG: hypothetical protein ABW215_06255 [Kibdelosporangium sp.]